MRIWKNWLAAFGLLSRTIAIALLALAIALVLAQIAQPFPDTAWLHHVPTVLLILAAPLLLKRWPVSDGAVLAILLFFALHTLGARYTYSSVPYDAWTQAMFGMSLSEMMGWQRNHYDRLVHFGFGLLFYAPVREALIRHARQSALLAGLSAIGFVLAIGALYEMFEWGLTLMVAPELADDYNGQQGDPWDAQKDMALAWLGAMIAASWMWMRERLT